MTRKLLTLAFAALALGATQAANINWDKVAGHVDLGQKTSADAMAVGTGEDQVNIGSGKWTVSAVVTTGTLNPYVNGAQKYPSILGIAFQGESQAVRFNVTCPDANQGDITFGAAANVPPVTDESVQFTSNASYEFVISSNGTGTLNFYLNGNLYGTYTSDAAITHLVWGKQGTGAQTTDGNMNLWNNNSGNITMDIDYVAGMTYDEVIAAAETPDPDPALPEPTALALLALGVAGVALRRRVA